MGGGGSKPKPSSKKEITSEHDGMMSSVVSKVNERDLIAYYEHQLETTGRQSDKHGRALVVDDSKFNRKILGKTIEVFFSDIDFAENGLEAINMVTIALESNNDYSIIFMDSMMPVMGGIEATGKIRELGFAGMIVGVTGDITAEDSKRFLDVGVNDVMLKPLLLPHVESILIGKWKFGVVQLETLLASTSSKHVANFILLFVLFIFNLIFSLCITDLAEIESTKIKKS
jgi:CheY-like chemotaxis protein